MNLLAIDTCTRRIGVAIASDAKITAQTPPQTSPPGSPVGTQAEPLDERLGTQRGESPRHVEELAPTIKRLLQASAMTAHNIDAVAVTVGPGMFTGLRVGMATACTFANALGVPMIALSSLDVLVDPLRYADCDVVVPTLEARRTEMYFALYPRNNEGLEVDVEIGIATPMELAVKLASRGARLLLCGEALGRHSNEFSKLSNVVIASSKFSAPSCASMVRLAMAKWELGGAVAASEITPMYLRQSDAQINVSKVSGGTM